jgi:hypothetical protein
MTDNTPKLRATNSPPLDHHPDALAKFDAVLNVEGTLGRSLYNAARSCLGAVYEAGADVREARAELDRIAAHVNTTKQGGRTVELPGAQKVMEGSSVRYLSGHEPEFAANVR